MAETSKRNWPWKKKAHDKIASTLESVESSPRASPRNSKFFDEQDVSKLLSDHARVSDEAMTQWQHSESKLRQLSEKLDAAQTELTTKDVLVKQHAKVAEEAVTGWEKAEAEAAAMKQQLDTNIQQKLATEDRVSHLDGALKECMRQLRHVREEQELRIHESIVKKTREYDMLRQEMEAKLAEVGRRLQDTCSEVIDSRGEACALSNALQERTRVLTEVIDAKGSAEAEAKILQVQLQSSEEEKSALKYELQVIRKEVEIRNVERDFERRVAENASKAQLENVKKIAKLEGECQRLRILVRKKLPGPAALAQMKIEVDALGGHSNGVDLQRKRSSGRSLSSSPRAGNFSMDSSHDSFHDSCGREAAVLSEKLVGMDEELKMVKEALAKRDGELQVSRLMCAKTASKLSHVEEQLAAARQRPKMESRDLRSTSENEGPRKSDGIVDPWDAASALLTELAEFKKVSEKGLAVAKLDLMDDFAEMERLAMAGDKDELDIKEDEVSEKSYNAIAAVFEKKLVAKQKELEEANHRAKEVRQQLTHAEEQLTILHSRNSANELALVSLQEKLDKLCDKGEDDSVKDRNITKELEDLVEAQSISARAGAANEAMLYDLEDGSRNTGGMQSGTERSMSSRSSSQRYAVNEEEDRASVLSDAESKASTRGSDLLTTVRSVVQAVEALAQASGSEHELSLFQSGHHDAAGPERQVYRFMQWKNPELDGRIGNLIGTSNKFLQGEADMVEFLSELTGVVNYLVNICGKSLDQLEKRLELQETWPNMMEKEVELRRISSAKAAMELHLCAKMKQLGALEEDPERANRGHAEIMRCAGAAKKGLEGMNSQLHDEEKSMSDGSNFNMECEVHEMSTSKAELDSDAFTLHDKVIVLEEE